MWPGISRTNSRPDKLDTGELFTTENISFLFYQGEKLAKLVDEGLIILSQDQVSIHFTESNDVVYVDVEDAVEHKIIRSPPSR